MKLINWILIIYIGMGAMFPGLDYSQWIRIGKFFQHYQLHLEENQSNGERDGFLDFLVLHLLDQSEHEHADGQDHHQQLPFQQIQSIGSICFVVSEPLKAPAPQSFTKVNFFFTHSEGTLYSDSIFQPPV